MQSTTPLPRARTETTFLPEEILRLRLRHTDERAPSRTSCSRKEPGYSPPPLWPGSRSLASANFDCGDSTTTSRRLHQRARLSLHSITCCSAALFADRSKDAC